MPDLYMKMTKDQREIVKKSQRYALFLDWGTGYCEVVISQKQIGQISSNLHLNPSIFLQADSKFYMEMQRDKDSQGNLEELDHRHQDTYKVMVIKTL